MFILVAAALLICVSYPELFWKAVYGILYLMGLSFTLLMLHLFSQWAKLY